MWDYDQTKNNDLIGVVTISMRDIIDAFSSTSTSAAAAVGGVGGVYTFTESVVQNGLVMGTLTASVIIRCSARTSTTMTTGSTTSSSSSRLLSAMEIRECFDQADKRPLSSVRRIGRGGVDGCGKLCLLI